MDRWCFDGFTRHRRVDSLQSALPPAARSGAIVAGLLMSAILPGLASAQAISLEELRASAVEAMGGVDAERIELTASGWDACLGQAWNVNEGWARWELTDYRRVIDYAEGASLQTAMRRAAMDPERVGGCGAQPGAAPTRQQSRVDGASAWADQLPIWLTPHGFLRLAVSEDASVASEGDGWKISVQAPRGDVTYTLEGYYDDDFELERIDTRIDDTVFGDMAVEAEFGDYREFGSLRYPESLVYKQGGRTTLDLTFDAVVPNTDAETSVPAGPARAGGGAQAAADERPYVELGDGAFVMLGAYQGVAVEFDDFSVVIDGLQNDSRSREMIRLTKEAIPDKEIRYVVVTHSHFDHASGLRDFVDEGAVILTHETNVEFFEQALGAPRSLAADETLHRPARPANVQGVDGSFVISDDAGQAVELHALEGSLHADDMLIAYHPGTKAIVESDLLQPWINPVFGGGREGPHPYLAHLYDELERLGLDYEQFVSVHRPPEPPTMPKAALLEAVGR
jgi:glyoxylase-like metal-dependent hydrolase (beta-lactamase superfamily II)